MGNVNISKKTAILLGAIAGVVVILVSMVIWGISTGAIKIGAYDYWFPEGEGGTVSGKVTCTEPCALSGGRVVIMLFEQDGTYGFSRQVDISSDGSYSFRRVPFNKTGEYYVVGAVRECPPQTANLGRCAPSNADLMTSQFQLTKSKPTVTKDLKLKPYDGRLVVSARQIIKNTATGKEFGQMQQHYMSYCISTGTFGEWDCPVSDADVTIEQPGAYFVDTITGKTDSKGYFIATRVGDYRVEGTATIEVKKGNLFGSGTKNVIGCDNNVQRIYLK